MPSDIESDTLLNRPLRFDFCRDEFLSAKNRFHNIGAVRRNNRASAVEQHIGLGSQLIREFITLRKHLFFEIHRSGENKASSFERVVPACELVMLLSVGPRCDMDDLTFGVKDVAKGFDEGKPLDAWMLDALARAETRRPAPKK